MPAQDWCAAPTLGQRYKIISPFFLSVLRATAAQNRKEKRLGGVGGSLPRAAASAALPWADMLLPFQGARKASPAPAGCGTSPELTTHAQKTVNLAGINL